MKRWDPARPLVHPLFWGALGLLVVNDHVLKGAGVLPGALTGKLSDVVGLLVAPWVLAFLSRATTRRGVLLAHGLVGLGFAGINVWPTLARGLERLSSYTPLPWRITVDPTDLLTLPALVVSFLLLGAVARREANAAPTHTRERLALCESRLRRALSQLGTAVSFSAGLLACMATSPPPPERPDGLWGSLFVVSAASDVRVVTMRVLREQVVLDCAFVAEDPSRRLSQELFGPVQSWQLAPGDAAAVPQTRGDCEAALLGGAGAAPALIFWSGDELPAEAQVPWDTLRQPNDHSILLEEDASGARFGDHPLRYPAPPLELPAASEGCEIPARGGVTWSEQPPSGSFVLAELVRAPDGCHALDLIAEEEEARLFLCLDGVDVPFSVGELLVIEDAQSGVGRRLQITGDSLVLEAVRGSILAGQALSDPLLPKEGCGGSSNACGSVLLPASVVVVEGSDQTPLEIGAETSLPSGLRLYLATAQVAPVRDASCDASATYLESFSLREKE